ncbi:MAG: hypothetical protein ACSHXF_16850 [Aquaticitalea sp.]
MALTKKKSRPIIIDNEKYRWLVSPREKGIVAFIAEKENSNGSIIEVKIESNINEFWTEFPNVSELNLKVVTPKDAELIIRQAQKLGWKPEESGKPNRFEYCEKKLKKASR